jgi:hypothetical protein
MRYELSEFEVTVLRDTHDLLYVLSERVSRWFDPPDESNDWSASIFDRGQLHEALKAACQAVWEVLRTAQTLGAIGSDEEYSPSMGGSVHRFDSTAISGA